MRLKCLKLLFILLLTPIFTNTSFPADTLDCRRTFARIKVPGLLPIPHDPVSCLTKNHWALLPERKELLTPEIKADLKAAYDRVFTGDIYSTRIEMTGLKTCKPSSTINLMTNLKPETTQAIDKWAADCLNLAKESTGEDLEIATITFSRGHRVGNDEGSLIHADNRGTYLHALVTLEGPTTFAFPANPELDSHRLMSADPKTGIMTVRKNTPRDAPQAPPFEVVSGGKALNGETLMFGGYDYRNALAGREAIQHASPPEADLDRLTLFISIRPKR